MTVRTRSVPFNLYGLALGILSMLIIPMYAVQTAHDPPWPDLDPPQQRLGGRTEHR